MEGGGYHPFPGNPNLWSQTSSDWTALKRDSSNNWIQYYKNNENYYVKCPDLSTEGNTKIASSPLRCCVYPVVTSLTNNAYVYFKSTSVNDAWIEISGIHGTLKGMSIKYWGDNSIHAQAYYIATTIRLYADDATEYITATRTSTIQAWTYTFPSGFSGLDIKNKLKIVFLNSSKGNVLVYNITFRM